MASNLKYSTAAKNAQMNALSALIGANAKIGIYNGAQPASPDVAVTTQTLLAEPTGNASGFAPNASGGVLTANAITSGTGLSGAGSGTNATWFRIYESDGTTAVIDGSVGTSGTDMVLKTRASPTGRPSPSRR